MIVRFPVLALAAMVVLMAGCGSKKGDRSHPAQVRVDAVQGVLAGMAGALEDGDAGRMASLWREDRRGSVLERARAGFQEGAARGVRFTLLGVRVEGGLLNARVTWEGVRGDEAVAGTFMLGLEEGPPARVVEISGSDPIGGGTAQVEVPAGALQ